MNGTRVTRIHFQNQEGGVEQLADRLSRDVEQLKVLKKGPANLTMYEFEKVTKALDDAELAVAKLLEIDGISKSSRSEMHPHEHELTKEQLAFRKSLGVSERGW